MIYLIFDRKFGCVYGATTDREKAVEKADSLNRDERTTRYTIKTLKDFASK